MIVCFVAGRLEPGTPRPLVLASNRDEFYDRPAEPPAPREGPSYDFYAPRDARAGGTWLGINEAGLVVALTNRLTDNPLPDAPSRGQLVADLLGSSPNRPRAREELGTRDPDRYNPFSLLLLDPGGFGFYTHRLEAEDHWEEASQGEFFLSNRTGLHRDAAGSLLPWSRGESRHRLIQDLRSFCRSHDDFLGRGYLCLHGDEAGTRSSSLILLERGDGVRFEHLEGHPCERAYREAQLPAPLRRGMEESWFTGSQVN